MNNGQRDEYTAFLPKLRSSSGNTVRNIARPGEWEARDATELYRIAESLALDTQGTVSSVPDIWGQQITFEMGFFDRLSPLNERIVGEWRGLMAVLCLREARRFPVRIVTVSFADETQRRDFPFLEACHRLRPISMFSDGADWDTMDLIVLHDSPIGFVSPATIVCSSADCTHRLVDIPWKRDNRFLTDPSGHLSVKERGVLFSWLEMLKEEIPNRTRIVDRVAWNELLQQLNRFQADVRPDTPSVIDLNPPSSRSSILCEVVTSSARPSGDELDSDVELVNLRGISSTKRILLVDRSIAAQWRMSAHEITVIGTTNLETATTQHPVVGRQNTVGGSPLPEQTEVWSADSLFTDRLFFVDGEGAFPGAVMPESAKGLGVKGLSITPILPVDPQILEYVAPSHLASRIRFEAKSDSIVVFLKLRLSGPDNVGQEVEISKKYDRKDDVVYLASAPVIAVWPNFRTPSNSWKLYFSLVSSTQQATVTASPYSDSWNTNQRTIRTALGEVDFEVFELRKFPEAFVCSYEFSESDRPRVKRTVAGTLLVEPPEVVAERSEEFKVGVDFGTTGTNLYIREGDSEPQPLSFRPQFLIVTKSDNDVNELYQKFLPYDIENTPFLSLYFESPSPPDKGYLRPLLDGHILYLGRNRKFDARGDGVRTDLKWGDESDRVRLRAFLEQLCVQTAVEAASEGARNMSWRFSYPSAFSPADRRDVANIWSSITDTHLDSTEDEANKVGRGLLYRTGVHVHRKPEAFSESIAAARYFSNPPDPRYRAPIVDGTICMDIGGGTTDIAIWRNKKVVYQTSILFAGRDIFLNPIRMLPEFLSGFQVDTADLVRLKDHRAAFYAQADALIKQEGSLLLEKLPNKNAEVGTQGFVRLLAIAVAGLFYYVGLVLRTLTEKGQFDRSIPAVFVAGNGSRIFHWLAGRRFSRDSMVTDLFLEMMKAATGFDQSNLKIQISSLPKSEVAFGLIRDESQLEYSMDVPSNEYMAGENLVDATGILDWSTWLTADHLSEGVALHKGLENFGTFLDVFGKVSGTVGIKSSKDWDIASVTHAVSSWLMDQKGVESDKIRFLPVFIVALSSLLEIEAARWADSNREP